VKKDFQSAALER